VLQYLHKRHQSYDKLHPSLVFEELRKTPWFRICRLCCSNSVVEKLTIVIVMILMVKVSDKINDSSSSDSAGSLKGQLDRALLNYSEKQEMQPQGEEDLSRILKKEMSVFNNKVYGNQTSINVTNISEQNHLPVLKRREPFQRVAFLSQN
jgi:hypothetical protein